VSCDSSVKLSTFEISENYTNLNSRLDYRHIPTLQCKCVPIVINAGVLVLWLVNWVMRGRVCIPIHNFQTAILVTGVITPLLRLRELTVLSSRDGDGGLTLVRVVFSMISDGLLCSAVLLISKGWCIVRDDLSRTEIAKSLLFSFGCSMFATLLLENEPQGWRFRVFVVLAFLSAGSFLVELVVSINRASMHILTHLLVITNSGVSPDATPIAKKHALYRAFQYSVIAFCFLLMVQFIFGLVMQERLEFWASELIGDMLRAAIYVTLAVLLRLRGSESGQYLSILDAPMEMALSEIGVMDVDGGRADVDWGDGMKLPGRVVEAERQRTATLSMPDGTMKSVTVTEEPIGGLA